MRHKWLLLVIVAAAALALSPFSLARPERTLPGRDRFIGFYVVSDRWNPGYQPHQEEGWLEYGGQTLDTQFGTLDIPRTILPAVYNGEDYSFPGLKGLCCFVTETEENGAIYNASYVDLGNVSVAVGSDTSIEGTVYLSPEQEDDVFTFYRVYQTPEGMVYLDGSGNSVSGGMGSMTETKTWSSQQGEEEVSSTITVTVHLQTAPLLQQMTVTWFSGENLPLQVEQISLDRADTVELSPVESAVWLLVSETAQSGEVVRTSYDIGEELWHTVPLTAADGPSQFLTLHLPPQP